MWACDTSTVTKLIIHRTLFFPTFLQRSSLFHASGLDNPFPVRRKDLGDISYTSRGIAFLSQSSLPWQWGSVVVEFVWHHSIAWHRKLVLGARISEICVIQVIAHFVSNFIAMATRVGRCKIWLTWLIDWAWFYISTNTVRLYGRWANLIDIVRELDPKDVVAMATGSVVVEFVWHHSIARPRKPPDRCRDLGDI